MSAHPVEAPDLVTRALVALDPDPLHRPSVARTLTQLAALLDSHAATMLVESIEAAAVDVNRRLLAERYGPVLHSDERRAGVSRRG